MRGVVALFWHYLEVRRSRQDGGLCGTKTLVIVSGELGTLSALPPQQSEGNTEPGLSPLRRDREELGTSPLWTQTQSSDPALFYGMKELGTA